jgi:D-alanine-D-alanine ligase
VTARAEAGAHAEPGGAGTPPIPVAVLLGGPSAEHDVSLVSGRAIAHALRGAGHAVEGWLIGLDGAWWHLPDAAMDRTLPPAAYDDPESLGADGPYGAAGALDVIAASDPRPAVFIALHGPFGEDGTVQALCESAGLVYTGAGVAASALGMDKSLFKRLAAALGMPVVPWRDVGTAALEADRDAVLDELAAFAHTLPDARLMIKPARLGSSVGMRIVHHPDDRRELSAALAEAFRFDGRALAEAYLDHPRELEMAVMGNGADDLETHGPGEAFPGREFYDYVAKYAEGVSRTSTSPDLPEGLRERLHELTGDAFLAIGGEGFARVDFLLGGGTLYLNEINTIPGFTPISLFPMVCVAGGRSFADVCTRILALALEREHRNPRRILTRADLP